MFSIFNELNITGNTLLTFVVRKLCCDRYNLKKRIPIKYETELLLFPCIICIYSNIAVYCPDSILSVILLMSV